MSKVKSAASNISRAVATEAGEFARTAIDQITGVKKPEVTEQSEKTKHKKRQRRQLNLKNLIQQQQEIRANLAAAAQNPQITGPEIPKALEPGVPQLRRIGTGALQQIKSRQAETSIGRKGE